MPHLSPHFLLVGKVLNVPAEGLHVDTVDTI